jgi:chemotaxis protein histidine kinase CheA
MDKWIVKNRSFEITAELVRLLAKQSEFLKKRVHTPAELTEYEESRKRVRQLFAELEQSRAAS